MKIIIALFISFFRCGTGNTRITNLDNNPGLLPIRLGNTQNVIDYWTFVQIFDLSEIINEFTKLETNYYQLEKSMKNATTYTSEFYTSHNFIKNYVNRIQNQLTQLNPRYKTNRVKRGLINGLGSIIKSLTGNLDAEDAQRYDKAINELSINQNNMKTIVQEQISILKKSSQDFKEIVQKLTNNQKVLDTRISIIETTVQRLRIEQLTNYQFSVIYGTITQILTAFQIIYDLLEKIETAITFSKLNTFHNSIIEPNELLKAIQSISIETKQNKLPFEPILDNILKFEKTLEIKSYIKENQIVFLIEVPIVENENYAYYHLYTLPTPYKDSDFKMIIPRSKYLILNEQKYAFSNVRCKEVTKEEFICHETNSIFSNKDWPCEIQVIKFLNISSCHQIPLTLDNIKVQKLEKHGYMVITPEEITGIEECGHSKENRPLRGSNIIEVIPNCKFQVGSYQLQQQPKNFNIRSNEKIPDLNFKFNSIPQISNLKPLELDSINLENLDNIQSKLNAQNSKLKEISSMPVYYEKTSLWTIFLYFILITLIIYFAFTKFKKYKWMKKEEKQISKEERIV